MKIHINDNNHEVAEDFTLFALIQQFNNGIDTGVALAVNEEVIRKTEWSTFTLSENDNILLIQASQGG